MCPLLIVKYRYHRKNIHINRILQFSLSIIVSACVKQSLLVVNIDAELLVALRS